MTNPDMTARLLTTLDASGFLTIILNRPEKRNAFDAETVKELTQAISNAENTETVRGIILRGAGEHFSSGADLNWMKRMAECSYKENIADAEELRGLMEALANFGKPSLAVVQGACIGGALGLIACCDLVVADYNAFFRFSEVLVGLVPAVISPYVINALGERSARRYFLTAEKFSAETAQQLGLIHEVRDENSIEECISLWTTALASAGPEALRNVKKLLAQCKEAPSKETLSRYTTETIARLRISAEGQEGLAAFLEKRKPRWQ
jgi:methylglutaconyl-CoA hydratase